MKQETLEETADKVLQDEINYWYQKTGSLTSEDIVRRAYSLGITTGAKWQMERMYSEEDMVNFALFLEIHLPMKPRKTHRQLLEQFKKK